jgi:hemin uptake protein HemP
MIERETPAVVPPDAPRQPDNKAPPARARRIVKSSELLVAGQVLLIDHGGEIYSLRETSKGKLILTK